MTYRQWPYNVRRFWEARDPAWKMLLMVVGGLVAIVALGMCGGCMEFRQAWSAVGQAQEDLMTLAERAADDKLADSVEWICLHSSSRSTLKYFRSPDQIQGYALLCGHPMILTLPDVMAQLRREQEQVEKVCEPEVGP